MQSGSSVELTRDCEAVAIPYGSSAMLPKGTPVTIAQTLGGTYTVRADGGGLYRIGANDADALGIKATDPDAQKASPADSRADVDEKQIWETLRTCYDPEIPLNIVDLGLIYDLNLQKLPSGWSQVNVRMTLTAPGCGMGTVIAGDAQQKLLMLDGVEEANVEIVWDPPWHQSMITAEGRRVLGLE